MISLRPDQADVKQRVYRSWANGNRVVLAVKPTGAGKSILLSDIILDAHNVGAWQIVAAHRNELVTQMSMHIARRGIKHRVIGSASTVSEATAMHREEFNGRSFVNPDANTAVASTQTLLARAAKIAPWAAQVNRFYGDEFHHYLRQNSFGKSVELFPNAQVLGVTATPQRADGFGLGADYDGIVDDMVVGISMRELINLGALSDYEIAIPESDFEIDDATLAPSGDWSTARMREASKKSHIVGDVVREYARRALGKKFICFATDVETATEMSNNFTAAGIPSAAVSAKTPAATRNEMLRRFKRGQLLGLVNVDLFGEGFDCPAVEVVIMARPTASLAVYLQQFGRGMRSFNGKDCVARGSLILTQRGLVSIEELTRSHKVWDGENFVEHGGAICRGVRKVIEYAGLIATPDHEVWTAKGWRTFGYCAAKQIPISQTGFGRIAVRERDNFFTEHDLERDETETNVCRDEMSDVPSGEFGHVYQSDRRSNERLSCLQSADQISAMVLRSCSNTRAALQQPAQWIVSQIWRAWDSLQLYFGHRGSALDSGQSRSKRASSTSGVGPHRKRRALRAGKYSLVNTFAELFAHSQKEGSCSGEQISTGTSRHSVRGRNAERDVFARHDTGGNHRAIPPEVLQTEREVWDILDCGPLSRFTAQGLLVHNCGLVIDHVSNYKRHGFPDKAHAWSLARREKRSSKKEKDPEEIDLTACRECSRPYEACLPACPYCGAVLPLPDPTSRKPETVDGDLVLLTREMIAAMQAAAVLESPAAMHDRVSHAAGPLAGKGALNRQTEKIQAQERLREAIALWAGIQRQRGRSDSESYRRFYLSTGVDVLSAMALDDRAAYETMAARVEEWCNV